MGGAGGGEGGGGGHQKTGGKRREYCKHRYTLATEPSSTFTASAASNPLASPTRVYHFSKLARKKRETDKDQREREEVEGRQEKRGNVRREGAAGG